jgi:hypothetical protein
MSDRELQDEFFAGQAGARHAGLEGQPEKVWVDQQIELNPHDWSIHPDRWEAWMLGFHSLAEEVRKEP